jgi:predicted RNA-binding protein associated with RNAse of E/G family
MNNLNDVLTEAWKHGISTKGDFARAHANGIAAAASCGLITTKVRANEFGTRWLITKLGLEALNECYQS